MKHRDIMATIELLAEAYPNCFHVFEQRRKPLKIGIHTDILATSKLEPKALSAALRCYCMNPRYLAACYEGAERIGLDGEPCGAVSAEEAAGARLRLEQLQEKHKRQREAKEQAERKEKNKGRISLDDLRRAARARRAA